MSKYDQQHSMMMSGEELCILVQALALLEGAEVDVLLHRLVAAYRSRKTVCVVICRELRRGSLDLMAPV